MPLPADGVATEEVAKVDETLVELPGAAMAAPAATIETAAVRANAKISFLISTLLIRFEA